MPVTLHPVDSCKQHSVSAVSCMLESLMLEASLAAACGIPHSVTNDSVDTCFGSSCQLAEAAMSPAVLSHVAYPGWQMIIIKLL